MPTWTVLILVVVLFWSVGAYNRVVRLRAAAVRAFAAFAHAHEARLALLLRISHARLLHLGSAEESRVWHDAELAVQTCANASAYARLRPLEAARIVSLTHQLSEVAQRMESARLSQQDLAGAPWPMELQIELATHDAALLTHGTTFNACVTEYNQSIAQWPAAGLALLFGLAPGLPIALQKPRPAELSARMTTPMPLQ